MQSPHVSFTKLIALIAVSGACTQGPVEPDRSPSLDAPADHWSRDGGRPSRDAAPTGDAGERIDAPSIEELDAGGDGSLADPDATDVADAGVRPDTLDRFDAGAPPECFIDRAPPLVTSIVFDEGSVDATDSAREVLARISVVDDAAGLPDFLFVRVHRTFEREAGPLPPRGRLEPTRSLALRRGSPRPRWDRIASGGAPVLHAEYEVLVRVGRGERPARLQLEVEAVDSAGNAQDILWDLSSLEIENHGTDFDTDPPTRGTIRATPSVVTASTAPITIDVSMDATDSGGSGLSPQAWVALRRLDSLESDVITSSGLPWRSDHFTEGYFPLFLADDGTYRGTITLGAGVGGALMFDRVVFCDVAGNCHVEETIGALPRSARIGIRGGAVPSPYANQYVRDVVVLRDADEEVVRWTLDGSALESGVVLDGAGDEAPLAFVRGTLLADGRTHEARFRFPRGAHSVAARVVARDGLNGFRYGRVHEIRSACAP